MKLFLKILGGIFLLILVILAGALIYLFVLLPKKEPPKQVSVAATPASVERGEYLANHVVVCLHCHSERKVNFYAYPNVPGTEGAGDLFLKDPELGELYAPNITPYALSSWSDGEIIRAVTAGVNKSGDPLFPIMPYVEYTDLTEEDLSSVIAYIRTLKPISHTPPRTKLLFPLNLIVRTIPRPPTPHPEVQSDPGRYLANIAGCASCHTPSDRGIAIPGKSFSGGVSFGPARSANITPDPETGIGKWTKEDFIAAFKKWQAPELQQVAVKETENSPMPWISFSGMREEDLGKIYDYLRTVPPLKNKVIKFPGK